MGQRILTSLVVGSNGHIGKAICSRLTDEGRFIIGIDRDRQTNQVVDHQITIDLTESNKGWPEKLFLQISKDLERHGPIQQLVYCAAYVGSSEIPGWSVPFFDQDLQLNEPVAQVGFLSFVEMVRIFERKNSFAPAARILAISSIYSEAGVIPHLYQSKDINFYMPLLYGSTKAALNYSVKYLSQEYPTLGINALVLGGLYRNQPKEFVDAYVKRTLRSQMLDEDSVAETIIFLLSENSKSIAGQLIEYSAGFNFKHHLFL